MYSNLRTVNTGLNENVQLCKGYYERTMRETMILMATEKKINL